MPPTNSLEATISSLYETVLNPGHWNVAIGHLASYFDAPRAVLFDYDFVAQAATNFRVHGHDPAAVQPYRSYFHVLDPGRLLGMSARVGEWLSDEPLLDLRSRAQREYIQDYALRYEIAHVAGCKVSGNERRCEYLSIARPLEGDRFGEEGRRLHRALQPHFERIWQMRRRIDELSQGRTLALAALDRLQTALMLVDRLRRIHLANSRGLEQLKAGDGLEVVQQRLACKDPALNDRLRRLVDAACTTPSRGGAMCVPRGGIRSNLLMTVVPVPSTHELARALAEPVALVMAGDPDAEVVPLDLYRSLFSLTPAEAKLLSALARGMTVAQWTKSRGVSVSTVRSQLRALFGKTGVDSQARLVALARSVPVNGDSPHSPNPDP